MRRVEFGRIEPLRLAYPRQLDCNCADRPFQTMHKQTISRTFCFLIAIFCIFLGWQSAELRKKVVATEDQLANVVPIEIEVETSSQIVTSGGSDSQTMLDLSHVSQPYDSAAHISEFQSIKPIEQNSNFQYAGSHTFQYLVEVGEPHGTGGTHFPGKFDFTGYIPIDGQSDAGYIGLNHELRPEGGVSILDIQFDPMARRWDVTDSAAVSFSAVGGTAKNCSGAVTPWNTLISCEETVKEDTDGDGYNDHGWCVEIDPVSRTILNHPGDDPVSDKLWAMGNFRHENVAIRPNHKTIYTGRDHKIGYLYRFVANTAQDMSSGTLSVFKAESATTGRWIPLQNTTPEQRNTTVIQSEVVGATPFGGIEDVEVGPDGMVYFAAKHDGRVYRFRDVDPLSGTTITDFETFVGGRSYDIVHEGGVTSAEWGTGNDNLAFDDRGNLWVLQDGGHNYIWVVDPEHTQRNPKVRLFGIVPVGAEPTGITFSPDHRFLFMSIQTPSADNAATVQPDAFGQLRAFDRDVALVIARRGLIGNP